MPAADEPVDAAAAPIPWRARWDAPARVPATFEWPQGSVVRPVLEMQDEDEWVRLRGPDDAVSWYPQPQLERSAAGLRLRTPYSDGMLALRRGDQVTIRFTVEGGWAFVERAYRCGWARFDDLEQVHAPWAEASVGMITWIGRAMLLLFAAVLLPVGAVLFAAGISQALSPRGAPLAVPLVLGTLSLSAAAYALHGLWLALAGRSHSAGPMSLSVFALFVWSCLALPLGWIALTEGGLKPWAGFVLYVAVGLGGFRLARERFELARGALPTPPIEFEREWRARSDAAG